MTLVREPNSEVIAQFTVPIRGTWKNIAAHMLPLDAVYDSLNVFIREGKLRNRPGLTLYDDTTFLEPIIGGGMVVTPNERIVLGITRNRVYQLSDVTNTWSSITVSSSSGVVFALNDNAVIDMAFIETYGDYIAIIAEQTQQLKKWVNTPRSVSLLTGTNIPTAKSVCIAASRVIALVQPHTVVWSNVQDPTVFDATAYAKRAQTGDRGICVRSISALSFVFYKDRSIHLARAQAGLDESTAFSFSEPIYVEGPAGIYAVVNANGVHYYMTHNGRIAVFDGTSYPRWIADGLWFFLQSDINPALAYTIRGIYDYRLHTVTFYYPKANTGNGLHGMVIINLPFEGQDIDDPQAARSFLGLCGKGVSHACEKRWDSQGTVDRSLLLTIASNTNDRHQAYLFDETANADEEIPFTCSFQTGLQSMPDAKHTPVTVETFVERNTGYGSIYIEPVVSDTLESPGGTVLDTSGQWIDLETNPIREYKGFGRQVRFLGLKYTWSSDNYVRYSGAVIYSSGGQRYKRA